MPSLLAICQIILQAIDSIDSVLETLNQSSGNGVFIHASFGVISLIMTVLVALFINGFMCPILILKQVCLIWKAVITVLRYKGYDLHFSILISCFFTIHQLLSCVFFHQIYNGVCEMIVQKNTIFTAVKNSLIAVLITAIATGIDRAIISGLYTENGSIFYLTRITLIEMGLRLMVTILIFFYGIRILMSLYANKIFRESQSQSRPDRNGQRNFLAISISVIMVFQLMKSVLHVLEVLIHFASYKKLLNCTRVNAADFGSQLKCFTDFGYRGHNQELFSFTVICYHLEDISIVALIIYWKIKNKK